MLNPWAKNRCIAFLEVGFDRFGVQRPLRRVRHQHHDQIRPRQRPWRIDDPQSRSLGLGAALGALRKTHPDIDARVPQAQRMCVALRAIPQDGDHPVLDDGEVCVVVVEQGRGHGVSFGWRADRSKNTGCAGVDLPVGHGCGGPGTPNRSAIMRSTSRWASCGSMDWETTTSSCSATSSRRPCQRPASRPTWRER